jgi:crotonobetainyl-CoA:carnitine CoA-transferase CaiB-like acyl-CoA transferase
MGEHCAWLPPLLGQQTDDVLSEIGISPEKIDELRRAHVVD